MKKVAIHSTFAWCLCLLGVYACSNSGQKLLQSNSSTPEDCIQQIMAQDDSLGTVRNHACETISLANTIRNYTEALQKLDFRGCPPAFATAFEKHRQAWNEMLPFVKKYPELRGEMHVLFDQLEQGEDAEAFKPLLKNVWDTWGEVERAMK